MRKSIRFKHQKNDDDDADGHHVDQHGQHDEGHGRFTGTQWDVHEIAKAGGYLYASENDYTGLGALDPSNPNRLFISSKIDPRTQVAMAHYEITSNGEQFVIMAAAYHNGQLPTLRCIVRGADFSVLQF